jgi:hypothetical protein
MFRVRNNFNNLQKIFGGMEKRFTFALQSKKLGNKIQIRSLKDGNNSIKNFS